MKTINRQIFCIIILLAVSFFTIQAQQQEKNLKLYLNFEQLENDSVKDVTGNGYNGILKNGASVKKIGQHHVLDLGNNDGYLDFEQSVGRLIVSLKDFTISTCLYIGQEVDLSTYGNFVWAFSTQEYCTAAGGEYIAYRVNTQRYEQSTGGWEHEVVGIQTGKPAAKGKWQYIVYTQSESTGTLYVDGQVAATGKASVQPKDMTAPPVFNWLGRAPFKGDAYLKSTIYYDFKIYDKALSVNEINESMACMDFFEEINHADEEQKITFHE